MENNKHIFLIKQPEGLVSTEEPKRIDIFEFCHSPYYWAPVDNWFPFPEEEIFRQAKNTISLPVSKFFNTNSVMLDNFMLTPKRCYNSDEIREHICRYLNYFERFYDQEHELLYFMYRIKFCIDVGMPSSIGGYTFYTLDNFMSDIKDYILSDSMYNKTWRMVQDNYELELNYKNKANEGLQYSDTHGKYFMEISIFMNMLIPLIMHFSYKNRFTTETINDLIFTIYNWLFDRYTNTDIADRRGLNRADMYSKLYETAITTMQSDYKRNGVLWEMSAIRGYSPTINANDAVNTVIMQVMPKYTFKGNVITYNITSIRNNIKYNISDISYEYDYVSVSSSKHDGEDNTSQLDKFESNLQKTDESLLIQNDYRAEEIMDQIEMIGGEVSYQEIQFYRNELTKNGQFFINRFQQNFINNMFFRYFGDTNSIKSINGDDYIKLIIIAKRLLISKYGMKLLPYIISSKITRISTRTSLCKKELMKVQQSDYYNDLLMKYSGSEKMFKQFCALVATTLSSGYKVIDFNDIELNGKDIYIESDILIDELIRFILLV